MSRHELQLACAALATLLLLPGSSAAAAEAPAPTVHTPTDRIHACAPLDDSGGVVAAGAGGLIRLRDGQRRVWTRSDGLPGTTTYSLLVEGATTWVGTEAGLARLRGDTLETIARSAPVRAIVRHEGSLYVGLWDGGLARLDPATGRFVRVPWKQAKGSTERARITSLAVHAGSLHVGTAGDGVYVIRDSQLRRADATTKGLWVWSIASHGERLWAATLGGVVSLGSDGARAESSILARALVASPAGVLLAADGDGRVLELDGGALVPIARVDGRLETLALGSRLTCAGGPDGLWIRRPAAAWARVPLGAGMPHGDIAAVASDGARTWVGFFDGGLAVLEAGRWRTFPEVDTKVNAVAVADGKVWAGTARGLFVVDVAGSVRKIAHRDGLPSDDVHTLHVRRGGGVLVLTARGVAIVGDGPTRVIGPKEGLPIRSVWGISELADGRLIVGTTHGVWHGREGEPWQRLSVASGHLTHDWVTAVVARGSTVWVGTYNAGVVRLVFTRGGAHATKLGGGWVNFNGLTLEGQTLHASTMDGLLQRSLQTGRRWQRVAGMPGTDVTGVAVADAGASLWVATRRGLAQVSRVPRP